MRRRRHTSYILDELSDKTQYVPKELIDKLSLWTLRIIFKLGGSKEFLDGNNRFKSNSLAYFLGVGKYVDMDSDTFKRSEVFSVLKKEYVRLEKRKRFSTSKILAKNIRQLSSLMDLNSVEEQIIEFCAIASQYDIFRNAINLLGNELNTTQAKRALAIILGISSKELDIALKSHSKLIKSSIVTINKYYNIHTLHNKIVLITDSFADDMLNLDEDILVIIKGAVRPCAKSTLGLHDYEHIASDLDILIPYLSNVIKNKQTGVNILLYGLPGTGKTELVKTISEVLQTELFEISYADVDDEAIDGRLRLQAYKMAQALLAKKNIILMYDEAEDIFESNDSFFAPKRQENKAWLNRILETNTIPTIWITNNINSIDNAMIRRFDYAIEMPIPKKSKREQIIKTYSNKLLDEQSIKLLADNENIAPALITRATKVVGSIDVTDKSKAFKHVLNNTLKAQGYEEIKEYSEVSLTSVYNPQFINTTTNLDTLTQGILEHQNARLCLYGPAGTGKSAYGKYIAQTLDKPLLLKKGSDLISMWVGGTEKNIANAFREAKEEKAVLVFDEVDSFLADRTGANQSWEVTQVNEMLVQMENFDGIFIATTNLMDNLDRASLRRFDLKLEFSYLKSQQAWEMFLSYTKYLGLKQVSQEFKSTVLGMQYLTPGDFTAVTRQNRFRPINDAKDLLERLEDEIAIKQVSGGNVMGFLAS